MSEEQNTQAPELTVPIPAEVNGDEVILRWGNYVKVMTLAEYEAIKDGNS